jgi:POT family proton-dependent oligopeptide transporter
MTKLLLVFNVLGLVLIDFGVLFLALSPILMHWLHGSDDTNPELAAEPASVAP